MNRVLKVAVVVTGWIALSAMVALAADRSDKADKKAEDAGPKPCCKALSRSTLAKLNKVSLGIQKAADDETKKAVDADLDRVTKAMAAITTDLEAKTKPRKKSGKDGDRPVQGPQTPACCQKICKQCLSSLGQVTRAVSTAREAETLEKAKPQITKAGEALAALKAELEAISKPPAKDKKNED